MFDHEPTIWGIHGGRFGDANALFLEGHCVGVGWPRMGDLSRIPANREAFKRKVAEAYPDKSGGTIPNNAGQLPLRRVFVPEVLEDEE